MKSLLAVAAVAALALGVSEIANAAPAIGGLDGIHAGSSLVQKTGFRRCAWRHGHRHCWWVRR